MLFTCAVSLAAIISVSFEKKLNGIVAALLWVGLSIYAFL